MSTRALLLATTPVLIGLSLLVSACGASTSPGVAAVGTTTSATSTSDESDGSAHHNPELAFSRCMRTHGVANFPDPDSRGNLPPLNQQALGVSKQTSLAAQQACEHLLSRGGGVTASPQQRQQKLAFGLRVARCLRTHGFPDMPDPGTSGQALPPGIDPNSSEFQTAETTCEQQARRALGIR